MKAIIPESSWRSDSPVLPCGHALVYDPKRVNYHGYLIEPNPGPHKCGSCAVEYEYVQLEGWETEQRKIAEAEGRLQTCPRRISDWGPWEHVENLDHWEVDCWGLRDSDRWPDSFLKPRTCSFCGGAHPRDVIALLNSGWEVEGTTKGYKRYLHPPGYTAYMEQWLAYHRSQYADDKPLPKPTVKFVDPIPPVKVYVYHFSEAEINEFNALLKYPGEAHASERQFHAVAIRS